MQFILVFFFASLALAQEPIEVASLKHRISALLEAQKISYSSFNFPEHISYYLEEGADLQAIGTNVLKLPNTTFCSEESFLTQAVHEIGHFVFAKEMQQTSGSVAQDYVKLLSALEQREKLYIIYDDLKSENLYLDKLKAIDEQIGRVNKIIQKYAWYIEVLFPLEELFADFYAVIYYQSPRVISEALACYSTEEAAERDYSQTLAQGYSPKNPYGHSDYLAFGIYFYKQMLENDWDQNQSLRILFEKILRFVESLPRDGEYSFGEYNKRLIEI